MELPGRRPGGKVGKMKVRLVECADIAVKMPETLYCI